MQVSMKLRSVQVENFRAIRSLTVPLDPALTVLHGNNGHGKTSLLAAIAMGLRIIPDMLRCSADPDRWLTFKPDVECKPSDVRRGSARANIELRSLDGNCWVQKSPSEIPYVLEIRGQDTHNIQNDHFFRYLRGLVTSVVSNPREILPVVAYYATDRAMLDVPRDDKDFRREFDRYDAYDDALAAKTSFKMLVEWFVANENRELRAQRDANDFGRRLPELEAVRRAITSMMGDVSAPRIDPSGRFVVTRRASDKVSEKLELEQLSGGYRIVLAMAADLAIRMVLANPYLGDPLQSEAIVLIDEIELHLHPEWQQRIIGDLQRTFPNAQFIVSTHSPQVLTTIKPEHIVHLRATDDGIMAEQETGPTYGAKAGDVLQAVMGVKQRPANEFGNKLEQYQSLIAADAGETPPALALRQTLESLSPDDPALAALDVEIRHHKLMRELAKRS